MDYALSKALTFGPVSQAPWILFGYDVNCQWSVHYKERFSHAPLLTLPSPMPPLYPAIGTWHVHGHKDRCFPRYATTFIKGAGIRSAEILESRWSSLNKAATPLRYMTLPHRAEMLDALMYDCNWKTMVDAGVSCSTIDAPSCTQPSAANYISRQFYNAIQEASISADIFEDLDRTVSDEHRTSWAMQERVAHETRLDGVESMDVYMTELSTGEIASLRTVALFDRVASPGPKGHRIRIDGRGRGQCRTVQHWPDFLCGAGLGDPARPTLRTPGSQGHGPFPFYKAQDRPPATERAHTPKI